MWGIVYIVTQTHDMGMDGSHKELVCAYTSKDDADKRRNYEEETCTHEGSEYDWMYYNVEEVVLGG